MADLQRSARHDARALGYSRALHPAYRLWPFDSGVVWRGGPYVLSWIDLPEEVTLSYDLGKGASVGRIEQRVFAVGWDERYLVAKQHPRGDRKITNFYIVDVQKDGPYADTKKVVIGPLTEVEFKKKSEELSLPAFTKELSSLK